MATATSVYTDRVVEVPRGTYTLQYSPRFVRTKADFYDTLVMAVRMTSPELISAGKHLSPPTAGEEESIYRKAITEANEFLCADELKDYFVYNDENRHARVWTLTCLRFRNQDVLSVYNTGDKITAEVIETDISDYISQIADQKFTRENWKDIIGKVNKTVGELAVPYDRGHVIKKMHPTFGIFTEIEQTDEHKKHKKPYILHAWLKENLDVLIDPISGQYDVAVARRGGWHRGVLDYWCIDLDAGYGRSDADSGDGFRPVVRGSLPETESKLTTVNPREIEEALLKRMREDRRTMPIHEFFEKHQL